jgi:hypothetical protein
VAVEEAVVLNRVSFHPSGRRLVTGAFDGALRIWDADRGDHLLTIPTHRPWANYARFDATGAAIISVGSTGPLPSVTMLRTAPSQAERRGWTVARDRRTKLEEEVDRRLKTRFPEQLVEELVRSAPSADRSELLAVAMERASEPSAILERVRRLVASPNVGADDCTRAENVLYNMRKWRPRDSRVSATFAMAATRHGRHELALEWYERASTDGSTVMDALVEALHSLALMGLDRGEEARLRLESARGAPNAEEYADVIQEVAELLGD